MRKETNKQRAVRAALEEPGTVEDIATRIGVPSGTVSSALSIERAKNPRLTAWRDPARPGRSLVWGPTWRRVELGLPAAPFKQRAREAVPRLLATAALDGPAPPVAVSAAPAPRYLLLDLDGDLRVHRVGARELLDLAMNACGLTR